MPVDIRAILDQLQPSDIVGVRSHYCVGRAIRWYSTGSWWGLSADAPNHLAQIVGPRDSPLWREASATTRVPCLRCGKFSGVHNRWPADRLDEEIRRGSTLYRYRFVEPFSAAEQEALDAAWDAKHGAPYDYWGAGDARLRGAGRLLALGLHKWIPDRSENGKWFCNEVVLRCAQEIGRWDADGNPSRWNPATAMADLLEREVVNQTVLWRPGG
jgi:hypothetical protein